MFDAWYAEDCRGIVDCRCGGGCGMGQGTGAATKPAFTISKETTVVEGPLRKDGTIDYVKVINEILSKGVTKGNNAAVPLLQALTPRDGQNFNKDMMEELNVTLPADDVAIEFIGMFEQKRPGHTSF